MTKAKTLSSLVVSVSALMAAQGALAQSATAPTAQELTRALNARSPHATSVPAPAVQANPASTQNPAARSAPMSRPAPAVTAVRPASPAQTQTPAQAQVTAPVAQVRDASPAPRIVPLNNAAIAALPFRIDLKGAQIVERPAGPSAKVYSVRRGETPLLMIYAGPQSDYPIYGGDQAEVAGRTSIVVTEGVRRRAVEHLFRREDAQPADIHVWVMAMDGADGDLAEQIAQTVDPR